MTPRSPFQCPGSTALPACSAPHASSRVRLNRPARLWWSPVSVAARTGWNIRVACADACRMTLCALYWCARSAARELKVNVCVGTAGLVFATLPRLTWDFPLLSLLLFQSPSSFSSYRCTDSQFPVWMFHLQPHSRDAVFSGSLLWPRRWRRHCGLAGCVFQPSSHEMALQLVTFLYYGMLSNYPLSSKNVDV